MADKAILKYDPQEVLRQPKEIGTFQPAGGDKGFYTLQFQSNGQPIKLSVRGQIENNGGIFKFDQFQKLRCVVDISGNGVVQYVTTQLI